MLSKREKMIRTLREGYKDEALFVTYKDVIVPTADLWDHVGRENVGIITFGDAHKYVSHKCSIERNEIVENGWKGEFNVLKTPIGSLNEKKLHNPLLGSTAIREHYVKDIKDFEILQYYLNDLTVEPNLTRKPGESDSREHVMLTPSEAEALTGDDGLVMYVTDRTPFQQTWISWCELLDFAIYIAEEPDIVEPVLQRMGDLLLMAAEVAAEYARNNEVHLVSIPDNITAPVIGRANFEKYCLPYYEKIVAMFKPLGIRVFVHIDGDFKPLWSLIGKSGIGGIDSFSPTPANDTSIEDAVGMWPDMVLIANFPSPIHLSDEDTIYKTAIHLLEEGHKHGRMWMGLTENVPPDRWRQSIPPIIRAIGDYNAGLSKK